MFIYIFCMFSLVAVAIEVNLSCDIQMEFTTDHQTFLVNNYLRAVRFIGGVYRYIARLCVDEFPLDYPQFQQISQEHYEKASQGNHEGDYGRQNVHMFPAMRSTSNLSLRDILLPIINYLKEMVNMIDMHALKETQRSTGPARSYYNSPLSQEEHEEHHKVSPGPTKSFLLPHRHHYPYYPYYHYYPYYPYYRYYW